MPRAIDDLMNEHRLIERVLGSLETFARNVRQGGAAERSMVQDFADFFRNFADKCHHGKEEDRLFVKMNDFGFPSEEGPIAVMLAEHVQGREHVGELAAIGAGAGPLSAAEKEALADHALAYVPLLRGHIQKEDHVLYPMAMQVIPAAELETLSAEFETFERLEMGEGAHARYHKLADSLVAAYPPGR